jgi:hypothetical protein
MGKMVTPVAPVELGRCPGGMARRRDGHGAVLARLQPTLATVTVGGRQIAQAVNRSVNNILTIEIDPLHISQPGPIRRARRGALSMYRRGSCRERDGGLVRAGGGRVKLARQENSARPSQQAGRLGWPILKSARRRRYVNWARHAPPRRTLIWEELMPRLIGFSRFAAYLRSRSAKKSAAALSPATKGWSYGGVSGPVSTSSRTVTQMSRSHAVATFAD